MSNKKISELIQATQVNDTDEFAVVQSGQTKRVTKEVLQDSLSVESGTTINLDSKGTMDNAEVSDFSTGMSTDFNVGGIIGGTLSFDASTPIRGKQSLLYTNNALSASSNDDWVSRTLVVPAGYRGRPFEFNLEYVNQFATGSIRVKLQDSSGNLLVDEDLPNYEDLVHGNAESFSRQVFVNSSVTQLVWGFQVVNGDSLKELRVDDVQITPNLREISETVFTEQPDSMIRLSGGLGEGSSSTRIRRFKNLKESIGSAITYVDSVADGAKFIIEEDGIYHFSWFDRHTNQGAIGFCVNANSPTTDIWSINDDNVVYSLTYLDSTNNIANNGAAWSGHLSKGDVITPQVAIATFDDGQDDRISFTAAKIGSVKSFPAFKDQKVDVPTSEIAFEELSGRGTGNEATTIAFSNQKHILGNALSFTNSNGTVITVQKDGVLSVSSDVRITSSGHTLTISRNYSPDGSMPTKGEILQAINTDSSASGIGANWSGKVSVGDVIRIHATTSPSAPNASQNNLTVVHTETEVSVAVNNIDPQFEDEDSNIRLNGDFTRASTNTAIVSMSAVQLNKGSAITYSPSSTLGDSFTINQSGTYHISFTSFWDGSGSYGFSLNSSNLSSSIISIPDSEVLYVGYESTGAVWEGTWSGFLDEGDVVRVHTDGTGSQTNSNYNSFSFAKMAKPSLTGIDGRPIDAYQQESDSTIRLSIQNGRGSVGTSIRRFSNIDESFGSSILYEDSANDGASFTALEDGYYSISYSDQSTSPGNHAISINASSLVTSAHSLPDDEKLASTTNALGGNPAVAAWSGPLSAGDVIRPHCSPSHSTGSNVLFSMSKVGSLTRSIPLIDSTVDIPTSELRLEGASSRGATDTGIVKFDNIATIVGESLSLENTANNGTVINILKGGVLSVSSNLFGGVGNQIAITKNQTTLTSVPTIASEIMQSSYANTSARNSVSATFSVKIGDVIRIASTQNPTSNVSNVLNVHYQETEVAVALSNVKPQFEDVDSSVRLRIATAFGSSRPRTVRFSNVDEIKGSAVFYQDSFDLGSTFTATEDGIYHVTCGLNFATTGWFGISVNEDGTNNITDIDNEHRLSIVLTSGSGSMGSADWSGYLNAGDVIRVRTNDTSMGPNTDLNYFTMAKSALPSIAEVDVTPFADINQQVFQATEWEETTLTFQGITIDSLKVWERRVGDTLEVRGYVNTGTDSATPFSISVPGNRDIDFTKLNANRDKLGEVGITRSTLQDINASANLVGHLFSDGADSGNIFGTSDFNTNASGDIYIKENASAWIGGDVNMAFNFKVPIVGWGLYDSEYERVYAVQDNENAFSARIALPNGGPASVTSQNIEFIDSVVRNGDGDVTITWTPGFFSEIPAITATAENDDAFVSIDTEPTPLGIGSANFKIRNDQATLVDDPFNIVVSRQGSDYKDLQRQIVSLTDFPRVNKTVKQGYFINQVGSSLLDRTGEFRFHLSAAIISTNGETIIVAEDDITNTRTKFVATRDCIVNVSATSALDTAGRGIGIGVNGAIVHMGSHASGVNHIETGSASLNLRTGDYITVGSVNELNSWDGSSRNAGVDVSVAINATAQDLVSVGNLAGGENTFSARFTNLGVVLDENVEFIDNVNRTGAGEYTLTFKAGFFTEIPVVVATANSTGGANPHKIDAKDVTTSGCNIVIMNSGAGSGVYEDNPFNISVHRQGADYRDVQEHVIELQNFPRVNKTLTQNITWNQNSTALLNNAEEIRYDLSLLEYNQDATLLVAEDDAANTRTKFVATRKCRVTSTVSGALSATNSFTYIKKNDITITNGSHTRTSGDASGATVSIVLETGDYLTFGFSPTATSASNYLSIVAESQELQQVASSTLGIENVYYDGYVSKNGTNFVLMRDERINTSGSLLSVTNTDHTRFTALQECSIVAIAQGERSAGGFASRVYVYDENDNLIANGRQFSDPNNHANAVVTTMLNKGDYVVFNTGGDTFIDSVFNTFSIKAEPTSSDVIISLPGVSYVDAEVETNDMWLGKRVYARAFEVLSDIAASNTTLFTTDMNLKPVAAVRENNTGMWIINTGEYTFQAANYCYFRYNETNGDVTVQLNGFTLYAGSSMVFKYTK